jgi:hypothetical protein
MWARVKQPTTALVALAVAVLVISACGGGGSGDATSSRIHASLGAIGSDNHEDSDSVCHVVTQADASNLFGVPATRNTGSSLSATSGACIWNATRGPVRYTLISHIFDSTPLAAKPRFATTLNGVGDRAYASTLGSSGYEVWFAKGTRTGQLRIVVGPTRPGSKPPSAITLKAGLTALARRVSGRL